MAKTSEHDILDRLTEVFRTYGYEGASVSKIAEATGLQRASLYYRFPGGKTEMAEAVLQRADDWLREHVLAPLTEGGSPEKRLRRMADRLDDFYHGGAQSCLLDALSFGDDDGPIRDHQRESMRAWVGAIAAALRDAGLPVRLARERAEDAVIRIEGALVMARATGDTKPFRRTLQSLPRELTAKPPRTTS